MQPITSTRKAWLVVGLLLPVALLNYLDRRVPINVTFSMYAILAAFSDILVLLIKPRDDLTT